MTTDIERAAPSVDGRLLSSFFAFVYAAEQLTGYIAIEGREALRGYRVAYLDLTALLAAEMDPEGNARRREVISAINPTAAAEAMRERAAAHAVRTLIARHSRRRRDARHESHDHDPIR